jgi:uncharacterized membrane protein YebE (DUF533 family)
MSRKLILSLATIGALAAASFVAGSAEAMVARGNGGHGGNGHRPPMSRPHHPNFHHHVHLRRIHGHYYVRPVGYVARVAEPGPCTCLWKGYTPEGNVVFKDLCTQEMASAPAEGAPAQASEVQAPGNFAGKSYKDYLAANPQAQKN